MDSLKFLFALDQDGGQNDTSKKRRKPTRKKGEGSTGGIGQSTQSGQPGKKKGKGSTGGFDESTQSGQPGKKKGKGNVGGIGQSKNSGQPGKKKGKGSPGGIESKQAGQFWVVKSKVSTEQKKQNKKKPSLDRFCPICYQKVQHKDVVKLPGCGHTYCAYCIVRWAEEKDHALCPQCKGRYDSVMTFRNLDGTVHDSLQEESICLLRRTHWYLHRTKAATQGSKVVRCSELPLGLTAADYEDEEEWDDDDYYCTNEIDDTEDFYFSRAAGSARIVLTNRKFGKNGFIRSGRVFAQSTQAAPHATSDIKPKESDTMLVNVKNPDRKKTNPKGKKALKREQKKREEANRLS